MSCIKIKFFGNCPGRSACLANQDAVSSFDENDFYRGQAGVPGQLRFLVLFFKKEHLSFDFWRGTG
jgi:hypothetical protein